MSVVRVSSEDAIARFARSEKACGTLRRWKSDPRRSRVVPLVLAHQNTVLASVTPDDVKEVAVSTEHALGAVRKRDVIRIPRIRDWNPDAAFTHVLSFIAEDLGRLPTYQAFRNAAEGLRFRQMLWEPAQMEIEYVVDQGVGRQQARDAMRWRIGNAYYSFLREAYVIAELRSRRLDVRSHPLADALFHVDCWVGDVNIELYIGNRHFRAGGIGRKTASSELLSDAEPQFRTLQVELPVSREFGRVHFPDNAALDRVAMQLRGEGVIDAPSNCIRSPSL
ncbi:MULTISPECIES: hypothetical protein [Rhodococcus]|uniref:hypothetical protein n=1 Tax=Rhodococcus TaxID=1827 RepID=UPI0008062717|nr:MULTISPECIES: hypothetical protein [Rhodococcus]OGL33167.1 MAG: hypothetical protein A3E20_00985 [Candidatus Saccharibacteria bacterium RIFCSPHIGHO2_12_FULL_47_16]OKA13051.1 hypothetical protein BS618_20795 [Rhodococcus erythropolis]ANQ73288.1 hypothetical protein AOT96_22375 [Rhodococcus sp. 008]MCZ4546199.1 hypothetical protein [Rhodococcus qingshengii]UGQ53346.1 hypothetical protein LRL17_06370 [Rhodococcus qingshengii]